MTTIREFKGHLSRFSPFYSELTKANRDTTWKHVKALSGEDDASPPHQRDQAKKQASIPSHHPTWYRD